MFIETIDEMLNAMEAFVVEARQINASDLPFDTKKEKILTLGERYGLA